MTIPTLRGRLLRVQTGVVVFSCALLVVIAATTAALLLRRAQDEEIRSVTTKVCRAVAIGAQEGGTTPEDAARDVFSKAQFEGMHFELLDREGRVLVRGDELEGWNPSDWDTPSDAGGTPELLGGAGRGFRVWGAGCGPGWSVRVATPDVLSSPEFRRVAIARLLALPIAILVGAWIGRALIRAELRPLRQLQDAAAALDPKPGVALGVRAQTAELASLEEAFDGLLARLGEALDREKRFAADASHELRTPLTVLRVRLETMMPRLEDRPALLADAQSMLREIDGLDSLVEALLILSRAESAPLPDVPVNLCDLARDVANRQALADGPDSPEPVIDLPDEILVRGSEQLLTRALANLVENARKFSGPCGRIVLKAREENGRAVLSVSDDGPGIPVDDRPLVFDRFFRGSGERDGRPGAGLGLAVVRAIVARHRGEVVVGTGPLSGAEITMTLPLLRLDD